jgi:plasmid stabilization system protein ParE
VKVALSPRTFNDFESIRGCLAKRSGSQEVADRYIDRLFNACQTLSYSADRYSPYHISGSFRMMPFGNYLMMFVIRDEEMRISHLRHAARKPFRG